MTLDDHLVALRAAAHAGLGACGEAFAALAADTACLFPAVNQALAAVLARPGHSPREVAVQYRADGRKLATQFPLAVCPEFSLVLCVQHAASTHAFTAPGDLHVALLGGTPIGYSLFELPAGHRNDVFDRCRLQPLGRRILQPGAPVFLDARRHVVVFDERSVNLLKLESRSLLPFEWAFDLGSLEAWQVASTSLEDTQLVYAAQAFAALGDNCALAALAPLLSHRRHQVRWAAMRAFARLGGERVLPHLRAAAGDSHPDVRRASRAALRRLGQDIP